MAFFDVLKQTITGKPTGITEPTFIRAECDAQIQIDKMEEVKKTAPPETARRIEHDIKLLTYGISGENNVAYELKHSYMPILILRDLYLEHKGLTAQIDFVVIDTKFILVIECKKMVGDIQVTDAGEFIRLFKNSSGKIYKKEGIYSPLVQNERHLELIKNILCDNMAGLTVRKCKDVLHSIVVFANPKTLLNMKSAKADVKKAIIRCDQLIAHMKNLHDKNKNGYWFPESGMYRVAEVLMSYHKDNPVDYTQKYNLSLPGISQTEGPMEEDSQSTQAATLEETEIYKELREYRLLKSREEKIKAFYVYTNAQLEQMITLMPRTHQELKQVKDFGDAKTSKYGDAIINIVNKYR